MKLPIASPPATPDRVRLELSGPKLGLAFEALVSRAEDVGGVEAYVAALKLKAAAFRDLLGDGKAVKATLDDLRKLGACLATVRRRASCYLEPGTFAPLRSEIAVLLDGCADTSTTDARVARFCAAFPDDRIECRIEAIDAPKRRVQQFGRRDPPGAHGLRELAGRRKQ